MNDLLQIHLTRVQQLLITLLMKCCSFGHNLSMVLLGFLKKRFGRNIAKNGKSQAHLWLFGVNAFVELYSRKHCEDP